MGLWGTQWRLVEIGEGYVLNISQPLANYVTKSWKKSSQYHYLCELTKINILSKEVREINHNRFFYLQL